jgi:hypothetical protein
MPAAATKRHADCSAACIIGNPEASMHSVA